MDEHKEPNEPQQESVQTSEDAWLHEGYAALAADKGREAEALEWADALLPDVGDEAW